MPEYQISYASTKAIAASRSAGARDVGFGVKDCPHQPVLTASIRVRSTSDSRHASRGRTDLRSVPRTDL